MSLKDQLLKAGIVAPSDVMRVDAQDQSDRASRDAERLILTTESTAPEIQHIFATRLSAATSFAELRDLTNAFHAAMLASPDSARYVAQHSPPSQLFTTDVPRSAEDVVALEEALGVSLPPSVRRCLSEIGAPELYGSRHGSEFLAPAMTRDAPLVTADFNARCRDGTRKWERWRALFDAADEVDEVCVVPLGPDDSDQWLMFRNTWVDGDRHGMSADRAPRDEESVIVFVWHDEFEPEPLFVYDFFDLLSHEVDRIIDQLGTLTD